MLKPESQKNATFLDALKPYWNNRPLFVRKVIGVPRIDPLQERVLLGLDAHDNITVRAGHGTGKSAVLAWSILHYMSLRYKCKIPCTSPTKHQLFDVLWPELSKWYSRMKDNEIGALFANNMIWNKESFVNSLAPAEWFAVPRTASKERPEALQGFHSEYILKIVDEASGVPDEVFEVLEGGYGTKETKSIWMANPTRRDGAFFRSHNDGKEAPFFHQIRMDCRESTLTPKRYIERIRSKYGESSNIFMVRVAGEFPFNDTESFIPIGLAESAFMRDIMPLPNDKLVWGVDVARNTGSGDRSVLARRRGNKFFPYSVFRYGDTMQLANKLAELAAREKPALIFVDVIGFGAGVYDRLRERGFPVVPVNVAETRSMRHPETYQRLRDELWGLMRNALESGLISLWDNDDRDLCNELSFPRYSFPNGKIKVESKEEMEARCPGIESPDIADAHNLTFAGDVSAYTDDLTDDETADYNNGDMVLDDKAGY